MKKIITILLTFLFVSLHSAKAEVGIGFTGAFHMLDADGHEITRSSNEKNSGGHSEDALVPELFIEMIGDNGSALGVSYIPTRDMGSKSRSDTNSEGDTGTYKAAAELDNVVQVYTDVLMPTEIYGQSLYVKLGIQHATIATLESLNSGSSYPDEDVFGYTVGLGTRGDLPYGNNLYYKADLTYTDFEDYEATSAGNKVVAELEDVAVKLSLGYKF